jgi:hypothetical protein
LLNVLSKTVNHYFADFYNKRNDRT